MNNAKKIIKSKISIALHSYFDDRQIQLKIGKFVILAALAVLSLVLLIITGFLKIFVVALDGADSSEDTFTIYEKGMDSAQTELNDGIEYERINNS